MGENGLIEGWMIEESMDEHTICKYRDLWMHRWKDKWMDNWIYG